MSLSVCLKIEATQFHKVEVNGQRLSRCSIVSSCDSQYWHLDGPTIPLFRRFSQVRIFLCYTNHMNSLIFIQFWFCHRYFHTVSRFGKLSPRAICLAYLRLKLPSLFFPHLSLSEDVDFTIFLYSRMTVRALAWAFNGESSL